MLQQLQTQRNPGPFPFAIRKAVSVLRNTNTCTYSTHACILSSRQAKKHRSPARMPTPTGQACPPRPQSSFSKRAGTRHVDAVTVQENKQQGACMTESTLLSPLPLFHQQSGCSSRPNSAAPEADRCMPTQHPFSHTTVHQGKECHTSLEQACCLKTVPAVHPAEEAPQPSGKESCTVHTRKQSAQSTVDSCW